MSKRGGLTAIGLFSGCGGFDLGASRAGFKMMGAYDSDPIAIETYRRNVSACAEVFDLTGDVARIPVGVDLVVGGPPCQGFSSAGRKDASDKRNLLWQAYLGALVHIRPRAFALENVWGFLREYEHFAKALFEAFGDDYVFEFRKFNTQFYEVPQARRRLFVVGIRRDVAHCVPWPEPTVAEFYDWKKFVKGMVSMEGAISDLGPAKMISNSRERTWGNIHEHVKLESTHALIAPHIPNGGSLRFVPDVHLPPTYQGRVRTDRGWTWYYRKTDPRLPARTITASIGPCYSQILAPDVVTRKNCGRWEWEAVVPSEYTAADGLYTSPIAPRRLTIRECARLQTFPDDFKFFGNALEKHRQIGNAVPVLFAQKLCTSIADALLGLGEPRENQKNFNWGGKDGA